MRKYLHKDVYRDLMAIFGQSYAPPDDVDENDSEA